MLDVLARVGKVVFPANDVRDFHRDVVHDVDEVENGFSVAANDNEVAVFGAFDAAADDVVDDDRRGVDAFVFFFQKIVINGFAFTFEAEPDSAVLFVGSAFVHELLDFLLVKFAALRLEIRAVVAAGLRAFVPVHAEPAHGFQNDVEEFLRVTFFVRVFDTQDEGSARVSGVKPVKQRGACASDVEKARRARCKTCTNFTHDF